MRRALRDLKAAARQRVTGLILFGIAAVLIASATLGLIAGVAFALCYLGATVALLLIGHGIILIGGARRIETRAIERIES